MATQIKIRRDTAANWTTANPILGQGEPALETDTAKQKIGDGATAWTSLAYIGALGGDVVGPSSSVDENIAVFDSTTGKLIKDGLINKSTIQTSSEKAIVYNVSTYGILGDGVDLLDGAITTATNDFTSASATFVAGDVGKVIAIKGADSTNGYLVTTISAYVDANSVTLTDNATTTVSGATFCYGTDDTSAIQSAIDGVYALGGGIIYFPSGIYILDGPLLNNVGPNLVDFNSQLTIPDVDILDDNIPAIQFLGEFVPSYKQPGGIVGDTLISPNVGTVLRSTILGSGTEPCVIKATAAPGFTYGISGTQLIFKDLTIHLLPNLASKLTMGGIDCYRGENVKFENIIVFPYALSMPDSGKPDVISVSGIVPPKLNSNTNNTMTNCMAGGLTYGIVVCEHVTIIDCSAYCCTNALSFREGYQSSLITKFVSHWCINDVDFENVEQTAPGDAKFYATLIQSEWASQTKWYDSVAFIADSNSYGRGIINYNIVAQGVGLDNTKFVKTGGDYITCKPISLTDNVNLQTGTTYTPDIEDAYRVTKLTNASPITVTIPPYTDLNYDLNAQLDFYQGGAGQVTFVGGTGVTINTAETLKLRGQYSACSLIKEASNTWIIAGDLELV
jgi:hypothetical protein